MTCSRLIWTTSWTNPFTYCNITLKLFVWQQLRQTGQALGAHTSLISNLVVRAVCLDPQIYHFLSKEVFLLSLIHVEKWSHAWRCRLVWNSMLDLKLHVVSWKIESWGVLVFLMLVLFVWQRWPPLHISQISEHYSYEKAVEVNPCIGWSIFLCSFFFVPHWPIRSSIH